MNDKNPNKTADKIEQVNISEEMKQSYIDYSMSVIAGRALPDVRDGLKPVHRRILYAMHQERLTSTKSHRKSSSVVGDVMGDFHPHGDKSIYDALVRMAQNFSMKKILVDGQGNFGSIDGDSPAAMRYTEARMSEAGELLLDDIGKDTVNMSDNYDGRSKEPDVLPSKFPNLLVNGSSGIAVGMSCNIPPHNTREVINATLHYIENPDCDLSDLMEHIKGPDFPTGGVVLDNGGIKEAYRTGRGKIKVRASYHFEEEETRTPKIVIDEIPYQTDKSRLVERIAKLIEDEKIEGIKDLRDESNREGIRIVIELKSGAFPEVVENQLVDSVLEKTYSIRNLAIVDGIPKILSLKDILHKYVEHRRDVVLRRSKYDLEEANSELNKLEAKLKALNDIDQVVEIIRNSKEKEDAVSDLKENINISEDQAEHIFKMRLGSLTSLNQQEVKSDYEDTKDEIERLEEIINNDEKLMDIIKEELEQVKQELGEERRTDIRVGTKNVKKKDLIPKENMVLTLTENNYMKRTHIDEFKRQNRGGKGLKVQNIKDNDQLKSIEIVNTHDDLLVFTDSGQIYEVPAYKVPEGSRNSLGKPVINFVDLGDENVLDVLPKSEAQDENEDLVIFTKKGFVKRTSLGEYSNIQKTGIKAINLENDDEIVDSFIADDKSDIFINTKQGKSIRFDISEIRKVSRTSKGVHGIKLSEDDVVVSSTVCNEEEYLLTITKNGYGKKTKIDQYSKISRYGKGTKDIDTGSRNGPVVFSSTIKTSQKDLFISNSNGKLIRINLNQVPKRNRATKGVILMEVENENIMDCSIL